LGGDLYFRSVSAITVAFLVFPTASRALESSQDHCRHSKRTIHQSIESEFALQPLPVVVTYLTTQSSIPDLTDDLSRSQISEYPIARGGLADVYRATRSDGVQVAVKCLRQQENKHVKVHLPNFSRRESSLTGGLYQAHCSRAQHVVEAQPS
jgi:hypothetical protein